MPVRNGSPPGSCAPRFVFVELPPNAVRPELVEGQPCRSIQRLAIMPDTRAPMHLASRTEMPSRSTSRHENPLKYSARPRLTFDSRATCYSRSKDLLFPGTGNSTNFKAITECYQGLVDLFSTCYRAKTISPVFAAKTGVRKARSNHLATGQPHHQPTHGQDRREHTPSDFLQRRRAWARGRALSQLDI